MRFPRLTRCTAFVLILVGVANVRSDGPPEQDNKNKPVPQPTWTLISAALRYPETPDPSKVEQLRQTIKEVEALTPEQITGLKDGVPIAGAKPRTDLVIKLYQTLSFEKVRELPTDKGLTIGTETFRIKTEYSVALAILRDFMINETYKAMTAEYGIDFIRLDFGNKLSGVKSDVDHTAYADWDKLEAAIRKKGKPGVTNIREAFEDLYQRWGISQEACDICVHSGKNRIPDWRHAESVAEFDARMVEVIQGLAATPDAYFQEGAWRMQVEMRSINGAQEVMRKLRAVEVQLNQAGLLPEQKAALEAEKARILENNPCTQFKYNAAGQVEMSKDASILDSLFTGVNKDILKVYALDVCVGNYLFHIHHAEKWEFTKYVLRSFEEGVTLLRDIPPNTELKPLEYGKIPATDRAGVIDQLFPGRTADERAEIKRVLDTAQALRDHHKYGTGSDATIWQAIMQQLKNDPNLDVTKLAPEELKALIETAKQEYNRASTEVMVWCNQRASEARATAWLEPSKLPELYKQALEKAMTEGPDAVAADVAKTKIEKLQHASYYALKIAFRHLTRAQIDKIIAEADPRYQADLKILDDVIKTELRLYGRTSVDAPAADGSIKPLHEWLMDDAKRVRDEWAKSYKDFWVGVRDNNYSSDAVTERVWQSVYESLGYERKISRELLKVNSSKWGEGIVEVKIGEPEWNVEAALGHLVNSGDVLSALNVLRVYQRGGGRDEVMAALVWEGLYRVPGLVHIFAARDAAHGDWNGVKFLATAKVMDLLQRYAADQGIGWAVPVGGHFLIYAMVAKTAVEMLGYEVFKPLTDDQADMMYGGRLGPATPPAEFSKEDADALRVTQRVLDRNREKLTTLENQDPTRKELLDTMRDEIARVNELTAKQSTWDAYQKSAERWKAGWIRAGIPNPQEVQSFDPILTRTAVPLKFFIGALDDDAAGPVNLETKPLDDKEKNRLENLLLTIKGLRKESGGMELPARIDRLCDAMDEADDLMARQAEAERAKRYLDKIASDREWEINACRQNLVFLLESRIDGKLKEQGYPPLADMAGKSADEWLKYATQREKTGVGVAQQYAQEWFDAQHPQLRSIGLLKDALDQVKARLAADHGTSLDLKEKFDDFQDAKRKATDLQRKERRAFLSSLSAQDAMNQYLAQFAQYCADYGLLVLASAAPEGDALVRLSGYVDGEGENKQAHFRVKVISSAFSLADGCKVTLKTKAGQKRPDGVKEVLVFAEVRDQAGKLIGTSDDIPASLQQPGGQSSVTAAAKKWITPPKLRFAPPANLRVADTFEIKADLPGALPGDYLLQANVGARSYDLWGHVERMGGTALFSAVVPIPAGRSSVTLTAAPAPPVSFTFERDAVAPADVTEIQGRVQKAKAAQAAAKNADDQRAALSDLLSALNDLSGRYRTSEQFAEAVAAQKKIINLADAAKSDVSQSTLTALADLAFRGADLPTLTYAFNRDMNQRRSALAAEKDADLRKDLLSGMLRAYDAYLSRALVLGLAASEAKTTWSDRMKIFPQVFGPDAVAEPHPAWGPEK